MAVGAEKSTWFRDGWRKFDLPSSPGTVVARTLLLVNLQPEQAGSAMSSCCPKCRVEARRWHSARQNRRNGRSKFDMVIAKFDMSSTSKFQQQNNSGMGLGKGVGMHQLPSHQRMVIPACSRNRPGKIIKGRPESGGGLGISLLYGRPLSRRRVNRRTQVFSTLFHCPDGSQHHHPPGHRTNGRRRVYYPQVQLLKQGSPQAALHLSDRTLPESMLPQPFAIPMGT
jgi:hypothetical protein